MTASARHAPCREAAATTRVAPAWLRATVVVFVALFIALVAVRAPGVIGSADPTWAAPSSVPDPAAPLAPDATTFDADSGDNGDEAVELSATAVFHPPYGACSVAAPPHADPVGLDPPRVPPPEA